MQKTGFIHDEAHFKINSRLNFMLSKVKPAQEMCVKITYRPDKTLAVYSGRKVRNQTIKLFMLKCPQLLAF